VPKAASISWWSAASRRDRDDLARWCETVGPVLFEPGLASQHAPPTDTLFVVSWNVHVGSGDVDMLIRSLRAGEFTAGTRVDNFVLLLQEAYRRDDAIPARLQSEYAVPSRIAARRGRGPDVSHLWRDAGLALLYAPSMRNGFTDRDREDRGNAIASTFALGQPAVLELPLEHQRRVVAVAVVQGRTTRGEPWRVRVADVHLDTALALMRGGPSAARRRSSDDNRRRRLQHGVRFAGAGDRVSAGRLSRRTGAARRHHLQWTAGVSRHTRSRVRRRAGEVGGGAAPAEPIRLGSLSAAGDDQLLITSSSRAGASADT
jgi:hypothetical protein